ncbi:gastrula zinc finger protein XlCGF66.1-like isoform X2 [Pyxicephalus adspersus]|uniref:gastrula zinc finger protein XlCGF66.1-like isoform X2 n=1 Tax=Pyxicephalus adspersus TaxID=30357 RepID=UPI003B5A077B
MEKEHSHVNERILNLTLEIIYLLTGEGYTVVKKTFGNSMSPSSHNTVSRQWNGKPTMEPSPLPLTPERDDKKILEVTQKITELLTGEVPIRCQDVTVYFSTEEWEYLEGHKDLYQDIMMKDHQTLISPDGTRNTPERCPRLLYSHDSPEEDCKTSQDSLDFSHNITYHQGNNLIVIKVEDEEEPYVMSDPCKEEVIHSETSIDGRYRKYRYPIITVDGDMKDDDIICDSPIKNHHVSNFLLAPQSEDLSSDLSTLEVCIIDDLDTIVCSTSPTVEKLYSCTQCGKCFTQNSNFILHQRTHSGKRPHRCSACGKAFTQKSHLFTHLRVHTGEKPYSCSLCGKCFRDKANLLRHGRIHKEDKPYSCNVCGRCFKDKSNLSKHHRIHTGEKPYSCFQCGKCFTRNSHLVVHQRTHLRTKSYSSSWGTSQY